METKRVISEKQAYDKMARICSRREYCPFDIAVKLRRMALSDEAIQRVVAQLEKNRFIDESRYARSFITDKIRFSKWGKHKIAYALRLKKIDDEIIRNELAEFSDKQMNESLISLLQKKAVAIKAPSEYEKRGKLIRFGLGKGFELSEIHKVIELLHLPSDADEF